MDAPVIETRGVPTVFGEIFEKNVTFCIDTSGSMYKGIEMVKEQLIETLIKMGSSGKPYMFNIIEFNTEVTQWADKLVTCSPQTVEVAKEWIQKLSAKTGTNTKGALLTALSDPLCQAVYLVTDGLPDDHPVEILDQVSNVGKLRPIHCIYLSTEEKTESGAIEFLEDLSIESYGSFHIITLTTHGCVERITPIYRADHANERVIRTLNGTVRPNIQTCSVATTLQVDPDETVRLAPRSAGLRHPYGMPPWGPHWYDYLGLPFRYYYPHAWSRYRPARGWIKAQEQMVESFETSGMSPAAGSLLINKNVLARRLEDGYFYKGVVKSQIMSDKFLVAFGPCKHGKFTETAYQDTSVFDIIDYDDARRHTILTNDKVLAPWEPEGERYGPGTVIEGHEKRQAQGPEDQEIAVSFSNGKVEKVPVDLSIWIPKQVYERLALELKMPREAREAIATEEGYPKESLEGYPTSGTEAYPPEYELANPMYFDYDPMVVENQGPWRYPFHPPYPLIMKQGSQQGQRLTEVSTETQSTEGSVPGTHLTTRELEDRVTSQLMEHKLLLDEKETEKGTQKEVTQQTVQQEVRTEHVQEAQVDELELELQERLKQRRLELEQQYQKEREAIQAELEQERLLKRREKQEENILKKSVTFSEKGLEQEYRTDSGFESTERSTQELEPDTYFSDPEESTSRDFAVNTDSSLFYRPHSRLVSQRPPWKKYWRADPAKPVTTSSHGPFRETALQAPLEAKDQNRTDYICEWTSPVYRYVDPFAKHNYNNSVEKLLKPGPPSKEDKPRMIHRPYAPRPMSADTKEAMRRDFKRRKEAQRLVAWDSRQHNFDKMRDVMQDQHRERIQAQIGREKARQDKELRQIEQSRESKKLVSKEVKERIEANQKRELEKEELRIKAMQRRREHREGVQQQREQRLEEISKRRDEIKTQRAQQRWDAWQSRLDKEDAEKAQVNSQHQNAKIQRLQHFQKLEEDGQRRKDVMVANSVDQDEGASVERALSSWSILCAIDNLVRCVSYNVVLTQRIHANTISKICR